MCENGLTFLQSISLVGLAILGVYLVGRLVTAAYFNSKQHYEKQRNQHG